MVEVLTEDSPDVSASATSGSECYQGLSKLNSTLNL